MSASAESQERWNRWYQSVGNKSTEKAMIASMMQKRIWSSVFMVASTLFVAGLTTVFYRVLTR
jgi:hypothetical protein